MSNALSQAALETLSIIAYKQPISRIEIDEIRGVQTSGSIQKLVARQLIEEKKAASMVLVERFCMAQRSIFMDYFGLKKFR
ncbi:SMC-Scp complex subunit ScpB [Enterococcus faecalis]|uniref:SMC-Scp complex subunit ScpB n=1 Tax=Enterococcus faecalis TaxID=1351 RepID=A0A974NZC0_ENTFL|nr:SMC-Scp complex subunit ScpB [Enterococcus faecalis]